MDIDVRYGTKTWIAEVWSENAPAKFGQPEPYAEEQYVELNNWCINILGYHARTAYHVFEFKKQSDLDWFVLTWA